jgi:two-component system, response regulator PdtaR
MRVLIVEDEAIIALHLAILVAELGHEVCATAASAAGAIALATLHNPHVVLMDVRLAPGSSTRNRPCDAYFSAQTWMNRQRQPLLPYEPIGFVGKPVLPVVL